MAYCGWLRGAGRGAGEGSSGSEAGGLDFSTVGGNPLWGDILQVLPRLKGGGGNLERDGSFSRALWSFYTSRLWRLSHSYVYRCATATAVVALRVLDGSWRSARNLSTRSKCFRIVFNLYSKDYGVYIL